MDQPAPNANSRPLVGITMGDPLGIGPEVIVKALADDDLRRSARYVIFGLHDVMAVAADLAEISPFWWREPYDFGQRVASGVLLSDFDDVRFLRFNGKHEPDPLAGEASFLFVEAGIRSLKATSSTPSSPRRSARRAGSWPATAWPATPSCSPNASRHAASR